MSAFLAMLMLIASSGIAGVLHRCEMEATSCCSPIRGVNEDGCDQPMTPPAGHSLKSDFTCHIDVVVGGVSVKQALLEKENRPETNFVVVPSVVSVSSSVLQQEDSFTLTSLHLGKTISPPSVEKYVLFDSFLI